MVANNRTLCAKNMKKNCSGVHEFYKAVTFCRLPWKADEEQQEIAKTLPITGKIRRLNKAPITKRVIVSLRLRERGRSS